MRKVLKFISKNLFLLKSELNSHRILACILLLAIFLRFLGVYPGFPPNHPDEPTLFESTRQIIVHGNFKPVLYSYGELLPELYALVITIFFIPLAFLKEFIFNFGVIEERGLLGFYKYFIQVKLLSGLNFLYWTRYLTALLGTLSVVLVYILGKKLYGKNVGLLAAFLLAVNYRHVLSSIFVLADAPLSFFVLLSIVLSFNLIKNRSIKSYLLAGFGLALALSVKYFFYVIPVFFLCHLLNVFGRKNLSFSKEIFLLFISKNLFFSLVVFVLSFFIINPLIFFDSKNFLIEYTYDSQRFGVTSPISILLNYNYHRSLVGLYHLVRYGIGDLLSLAIIVGFLYSIIRKFGSTLVLSFVIIPFLIVFLVIAAPSSARYYTAIMPLLLLFPSFLVVDIFKFIKMRTFRVFLMIIIVVILAFPSLRNSYLTSLYFSWPQTQTGATKWLEDNLPRDSIVAVSAVSLPLTKNIKEIDINPVGPTTLMSMEELRKNNAQWIVVSSFYTTSVNAQAWINSNLVGPAFFNDDLFWKLIDNTYISLVLNDIGSYRIKEFVKPFWQSPERAIIIAKMPNFWQIRKDKSVIYYGLDKTEEQKTFSKMFLVGEVKPASFSASIGHENLGSMYLDTRECQSETRISSDSFLVDQNKWYSGIGFVKRENNPIYAGYRDGFLRLDFYSKNNTKLKTYVSKLLVADDNWQELTLAGFAPVDSRHARISFQLDKCFPEEKYFIDDLQVFSADNVAGIDIKEYPFYNKQVPKNLLWLPEL